MPPATPRTMRGFDDSGVAQGIGEGVQVAVGVLTGLFQRDGLKALFFELFGRRAVELQLALVELFHRQRQRLVRQRRHLRRDQGAVARTESVVVLVDLAGPDRRDGHEREFRVANLVEKGLNGRINEGGAFGHGVQSFSEGGRPDGRSSSSIESISLVARSTSSLTTTRVAIDWPFASSCGALERRFRTCSSASPRPRRRSSSCSIDGATTSMTTAEGSCARISSAPCTSISSNTSRAPAGGRGVP